MLFSEQDNINDDALQVISKESDPSKDCKKFSCLSPPSCGANTLDFFTQPKLQCDTVSQQLLLIASTLLIQLMQPINATIIVLRSVPMSPDVLVLMVIVDHYWPSFHTWTLWTFCCLNSTPLILMAKVGKELL